MTTPTTSLNIASCAKKHHCRTRNLHDGYPVPETRKRGQRRSKGFNSLDERHDAVICRDGYVDIYDNGKFGWCILAKTPRLLNRRLEELQKIGAVVTQFGHSEAAGWVEANLVDKVLRVLRVWRRKAKKD